MGLPRPRFGPWRPRWTDGQMLRWTDSVLNDFVPFGAAAQKAKLRVPIANLTVLRAQSRVLRA